MAFFWGLCRDYLRSGLVQFRKFFLVVAAANPSCVDRKKHLQTVTQLLCKKARLGAAHETERGIAVTHGIRPSVSDAQALERNFPIALNVGDNAPTSSSSSRVPLTEEHEAVLRGLARSESIRGLKIPGQVNAICARFYVYAMRFLATLQNA